MQKIDKRLVPWNKRFLSKSGRLVLIKAVISSILTFYMLVFKVPVSVAMKIEKMKRDFFWGDGIQKKSMHLVDWNNICISKSKVVLELAIFKRRIEVF